MLKLSCKVVFFLMINFFGASMKQKDWILYPTCTSVIAELSNIVMSAGKNKLL